MSSQEQIQSGGATSAGPASERPNCPKCSRPMGVKQVMPVLFASDLDDVLFGCAECGTEAKRTVKRA
jgi:RNase P subunit RPR2